MNTPADAAPEQPEQPEQPDGATRGDEEAAPQPSAAARPKPGLPELAPVTPPAPILPEPVLPAPILPAPILPAQSREDTDVGWGDYAERDDDDRLLRDRPPHWGNG
jgi:hypothetical protein